MNISYMHRRYTIINNYFQFCRKRKGIVRSAVVVILQPVCVFYFVTLLISMSFMNTDQCIASVRVRERSEYGAYISSNYFGCD